MLIIVMGSAPLLALAGAGAISAVVSGNARTMLWSILLSLPASIVLGFGFPATLLSPPLMAVTAFAIHNRRHRFAITFLSGWLLLWLWVLIALARAPVTGP